MKFKIGDKVKLRLPVNMSNYSLTFIMAVHRNNQFIVTEVDGEFELNNGKFSFHPNAIKDFDLVSNKKQKINLP